jgi:hypothetical protein
MVHEKDINRFKVLLMIYEIKFCIFGYDMTAVIHIHSK